VTHDAHAGSAAPGSNLSRLPELLRAGFEPLPIGVLMTDDAGAIVLLNRSLERLLDYTKAELIGQSLEVVLPNARAAGEHYARRKDGAEIPVEIEITPMSLGGGAFAVVSVLDLTERRRTQARLRETFEQRITFEALIGDLASRFVNLRQEDVHRSIEEGLARLGRALGLDRSALFQAVEESGDFVYTHQWTRPGGVVPPPRLSARQQFPWLLSKVRAGETVVVAELDDVPDPIDREGLRALGTRSTVIIPLVIKGRSWGALTFAATDAPRRWSADTVNRFQVAALMFANVLARKEHDDDLRRALVDHVERQARLGDENAYLRDELSTFVDAPVIVGNSAGTRRVLEQVRQAAAAGAPVLLVGETGTGKSLMATRLHQLSARRDRALVRLHCPSLPAGTIEAELFGCRSGVYMEGESRQIGKLELGSGSTVFFDEIANLTLDAQARLAGALRRREIQPLGAARPISIDVRVVAATRHDLGAAVAAGTFREDLWGLIGAAPIVVPPLRQRVEDITPLVWRFVDEFSAPYARSIDAVDEHALTRLERYSWPGNARELRTVIERAMIAGDGRRLRIPSLHARSQSV
jgi:transcriptional regulator with GAF, ATPase, and Fis domain